MVPKKDIMFHATCTGENGIVECCLLKKRIIIFTDSCPYHISTTNLYSEVLGEDPKQEKGYKQTVS